VCIQGGEGRGVGTVIELQRVRDTLLLGGGSVLCAVGGWVGDCGGGVQNIFFLWA